MKFTPADNLSAITREVTVFWMRRDLRIQDNAALFHALHENQKVVSLFIFDTAILEKLEDRTDGRVEFILESLKKVQADLVELGSSLIVAHGDPVDIFSAITPHNVYTNRDYESYARARDNKVQAILEEKGIAFNTYKDHVIFEQREIVKQDGNPYTVFTPYSRTWKASLTRDHYKGYACKKYFSSFLQLSPLPLPTLTDLGFSPSRFEFPVRTIRRSLVTDYHTTRDIPSLQGTSRLGVHLRFGTVSIRQAVAVALERNATWLNELIWREFYSMILFNFPHVETSSFKPAYDRIPWRNREDEFDRWCNGETGYPMVDAGMRELHATGFMHNRVRMVAASFLTKHLLIDWRWGEAFFAKKLLDYELASNNGGWQWAAGSGCDAAPYFRIFNPDLQQKKFDPDEKYIRNWIPEFGTSSYPLPMVDHVMARNRAIQTYKSTVG